jgi:hypothetical protein
VHPYLGSTTPFSAETAPRDLLRELIGSLHANWEVELVAAGAKRCLELECAFRRRWWAGGDDPLRLALSNAKLRAHQFGPSDRLAEAFREMRAQVHSPSWRARLRTLAAGASDLERDYFQRAFRAAQQIWTRAARWEVLRELSDTPAQNPFLYMARLFEHGVWPLGFADGRVWAIQLSGSGCADGPRLHIDPGAPTSVFPRRLYASAEFEEEVSVKCWQSCLSAQGWELVHTRVDENQGPLEHLLGETIRQCAGVLALVDPDPDFGSPWWVFQEIDYAMACNKPVFVVTSPQSLSQPKIEDIGPWLTTVATP